MKFKKYFSSDNFLIVFKRREMFVFCFLVAYVVLLRFFDCTKNIFFRSSYLIRYISLAQVVDGRSQLARELAYMNVRLRLRPIDLRAEHDDMDGKKSEKRSNEWNGKKSGEKKEKRNENKNFHWTRILSS